MSNAHNADEPVLTETVRELVRRLATYRYVLRRIGLETDLRYLQDRSECPYYRDPNNGVCQSGCWEEPKCHTDEPMGGWPLQHLRSAMDEWHQRQF